MDNGFFYDFNQKGERIKFHDNDKCIYKLIWSYVYSIYKISINNYFTFHDIYNLIFINY